MSQRCLVVYSTLLTIAFGWMLLAAASPAKKLDVDELTVHRINVVEPDGTLRMVISDHAKLPGIIAKGKEQAFDRPQAGLIFYNDEGSENGGLIFGGKKNAKGEVVDSGGSLSFDKYGANQIVQVMGVEDSTDKMAGLAVLDSVSGTDTRRRIWVGRGDDGIARISLCDGNGHKRLALQVTAAGEASIAFLDDKGAVVNEVKPTKR